MIVNAKSAYTSAYYVKSMNISIDDLINLWTMSFYKRALLTEMSNNMIVLNSDIEGIVVLDQDAPATILF